MLLLLERLDIFPLKGCNWLHHLSNPNIGSSHSEQQLAESHQTKCLLTFHSKIFSTFSKHSCCELKDPYWIEWITIDYFIFWNIELKPECYRHNQCQWTTDKNRQLWPLLHRRLGSAMDPKGHRFEKCRWCTFQRDLNPLRLQKLQNALILKSQKHKLTPVVSSLLRHPTDCGLQNFPLPSSGTQIDHSMDESFLLKIK